MAQKGEVRSVCFCSLEDFGAGCFEQSGRGREKRTVQENVKFLLLSCLSESNELKKCVCVEEILKQEPKENNI